MASKLRYDTAAIRSAAGGYVALANEMERIKNRLNKSIDELVMQNWRSAAGRAFEETYSADWSQNVDKYIAVLNEFAKMLRKVAVEYDAVTRVAERIRF